MDSSVIMLVVGTRPCAIKMAPLARVLSDDFGFKTVLVTTSQQRELFAQVAEVFNIHPDVDLDIMQPGQTPGQSMSNILTKMQPVLDSFRPSVVLVQGDTSTAIASAWAAFLNKIPVGHVEAGLRSNNKYHPFPEEINRRQVTVIADYHFAPTEDAAANLRKENVPEDAICVTGQTGIDALEMSLPAARARTLPFLPADADGKRIILLTAHRRENIGAGLANICTAVRRIVEEHEDVLVVCPVHPNPNVKGVITGALGDLERVVLVDPLSYLDFIALMERSYLLLTDSGGLQEEGPHLNKPVLVLRETTERPEALAAGATRLVATDVERIVGAVSLLLRSADTYSRMAQAGSPYGDGRASHRIGKYLMASREKKGVTE